MAYSTVTLTGRRTSPSGRPHRGYVTVEPSVSKIIDSDGNVVLSGRSRVDLVSEADAAEATPAGSFSIVLPATDDASLNPTGFTYLVRVVLHDGPDDSLTIDLPAAVPVVDLADKTEADPSAPTYTERVNEATEAATAAGESATLAASSATTASTAATTAQAAATEAETSRGEAVAAATTAEAAATEVAAVEATNDGIMTAVAEDSASSFSATLSTTIATRVPLELAADDTPAQAAAAAAGTAVDNYLGMAPTALFDKSTNLFIKDTATEGKAFTVGGSAPVNSSSNGISDYIPVTAGATYIFTGGPSRITYFNAAKTYVSDSGGIAAGSTRTVPTGVAFARLTLPVASFTTGQMNAGTVLAPYEAGHPARVTPDHAPQVEDIAPVQTVFFNRSTNLYNRETIVLGELLTAGSGTPTDDPSYTLSDWIAVESVAPYTYSLGVLRISYYDADRTWLGDYTPTSFPITRTTPPRTRWVRLSVLLTNVNTTQMNAGSTLLPYEQGGERVKRTNLPELRRAVIDDDIAGVFSAPAPVADLNATISTSTPATVYAAYDALVTAHPTYVTRTLIGNEASVDALPIYRYDFEPVQPDNTSAIGNPTRKPKVILVSGTHGNERASVWSMLKMFENIADNWQADPILAALRFNVHFVVVPVANPSGYRDNTRINANGVDPARNWPTMWTQGTVGSTTYGGTAPYSEPETLAMKSVLDAETDALVVLDYHNFHTPSDDYTFLYGTPGNDRTAEIISAVVRRMDRKWKADEPTIVSQDPDMFIGYLSGVPGGSLGIESVARGYPTGLTFEMCWKVPPQSTETTYSSLAMTWGYEALVNYVTLTLTSV